jgi:hypothetical protein
MSGEAKKNLKNLICAGIVTLVLAGCAGEARGTLSNSSSIVEDGLEYYIELDNAVYNLGESIVILCRVTNVGDQSLNVSELTLTYTVSFELTRPEGDILFAPYYVPGITPPPLPGFPDIVTLNPGEHTELRSDITLIASCRYYRWGADGEVVDEPFTTLGQYSIISEYDNSWTGGGGPLTLVPDALEFVIIPEPATILLFGLGGLLLRKRRG